MGGPGGDQYRKENESERYAGSKGGYEGLAKNEGNQEHVNRKLQGERSSEIGDG